MVEVEVLVFLLLPPNDPVTKARTKGQRHRSDDDRDGTRVAPPPLLGALKVGHPRLAIGVLAGSLVDGTAEQASWP